MERLDEKDLAILALIQENCKLTAKAIARKVGSTITTVFAKVKRMEELGLIKAYKAILDPKKLNSGTTAFILASVSYRAEGEGVISQREIAKEIAKFPEVQEVHIITGEFDILIKVKAADVDAVGKFVIDRLRLVKGIEKTFTCMVLESQKETTDVPISTSWKSLKVKERQKRGSIKA